MHKTIAAFSLAIILILTLITPTLASWQINVEISTPDPNSDTGIASNKLVIGADSTATDGYDNKFDTIALLDGPVQAFFNHPEYEPGYQKLWGDFRKDSLPQEWEIEIQSEANKTVNISWQIDPMNKLNLVLTDKESNQEIVIKSSRVKNGIKEYSYTHTTATPKRFLLKVTENLNASQTTSGAGKGGGCGYVKNAGKREGNSRNEYGQNILNMFILITPLLFPILFRRRSIEK